MCFALTTSNKFFSSYFLSIFYSGIEFCCMGSSLLSYFILILQINSCEENNWNTIVSVGVSIITLSFLLISTTDEGLLCTK